MPKVMLTTPYPTIEETARLLGISAKERDEIVARVAVKAEAARAALREAQAGKGAGTLGVRGYDLDGPRAARRKRRSTRAGRSRSERHKVSR
jgi:hypothetical protein